LGEVFSTGIADLIMQREGPSLEVLLRRLTETPEDFMAEPKIAAHGEVDVRAVVGDLLRMCGQVPNPAALAEFVGGDARRDRNRLAVTLLMCWLLADEWFHSARLAGPALVKLLHEDATEIAALVGAKKFVSDPDRREELARLVLARLGCRPAGESTAHAQDRLTTLSSLERSRVLKVSQVAAQRAREIREALARKAAEESADKWTRE
jgi:hypothetical protein